eukprot:gene11878-2428_t
MLRAILNIDWETHPTLAQLYGDIPKVSMEQRERRAGHAWRSKEEVVSDVLLWRPLLKDSLKEATQQKRTLTNLHMMPDALKKICQD